MDEGKNFMGKKKIKSKGNGTKFAYHKMERRKEKIVFKRFKKRRVKLISFSIDILRVSLFLMVKCKG